MPRKRSRLEELLAALEIPECGCDPFTECPCEEPCDCPRHLKPEPCEHVVAAGQSLTLEEWRELFEGLMGRPRTGKALDVAFWRAVLEHCYGRLAHDHPDFHGEPPEAPRKTNCITHERLIVVRRRRHAQGYALRHKKDESPTVCDKVGRRPDRRADNNKVMSDDLEYVAPPPKPDPDELWEQAWEQLLAEGIKLLPYPSIMKWTPRAKA